MALRENSIVFLDDGLFTSSKHVVRQWHQATKHPYPVISSHYPWEGNRVYIFGSAHSIVGSPVRMWYQALDFRGLDAPGHMNICYAESLDGFTFEKPLMDICPYEEWKRTNIIMGNPLYPGNPYCPSVILDDDGSYKMTVWYEGWSDKVAAYSGAKTFHSIDGLHFVPCEPDRPYIEEIRGKANDVNCLSPDKLDGEYVSYQIMQQYLPEGRTVYKRDLITGRERIVAMHTSKDFITWNEPKTILAGGKYDPDFMQFYGMCAGKYGSVWFGIAWTYWVHSQTMDTEYVISLDGRTWKRAAPGFSPIPLGKSGSFDQGMIQVATSPVIVGGQLLWYYGGSVQCHDQTGSSSIGVASWPVDGFATMYAPSHGEIVTKPITVNGSHLYVNAQAYSGRLQIGLLDEAGTEIPGFTTSECEPIEENTQERMVRWQNKNDVAALTGHKVSILFKLVHAGIRSCTFR
ncbi:MAG: hypothetical protein WC199_05245 [Dysgonamonadaceae bacterium]|nr:hypothetical protein [Sphaerochaetaceae bacterium]